MNNPFQLNYNQYRQQFSQLPVDDMIQVGEAWNQQYIQGVQQADKLKDQILAIDVTDQDTPYKDQLVQGALASIEEFSDKGNFEDAPIEAMRIARGLKDNAWLNNAMERYASIQQNLKELRDVDASDTQMYGFKKHLEKYGVTPTEKNKFGEYDRYQSFDAFKEPDLRKMVKEEMDALKTFKTSRIVENGKIMYVLNGEKLTEDRLYEVARSTVMNDPKARRLIEWETDMNFENLSPEHRQALIDASIKQRQSTIESRRSLLNSAPKGGITAMDKVAKATLKKREGVKHLFEDSAKVQGIDPSLLDFIAYQESRYTPEAVSPVGAGGMMQFMPETAKEYGIDPFNPEQAIPAAAQYMKNMLEAFGGDAEKALAAYNAGPGNVNKAVKAAKEKGTDWRDELPNETKVYLANWNRWNGPSPEVQSDYQAIEGLNKADETVVQTLSTLASTPEGLNRASRQLLQERLMQEKFGSLAAARAFNTETITNLRQLRNDSDGTGKGKIKAPAFLGQSAAGVNTLAEIPAESTKQQTDLGIAFRSLRDSSDAQYIATNPAESVTMRLAAAYGLFKARKAQKEEDKKAVDKYAADLKGEVNKGVFEPYRDVLAQQGYQLVKGNDVSKTFVESSIKKNALRTSAVYNMGEDIALLGNQMDEDGRPFQDNSSFYITGDATDGGGDLAHTTGLVEVQERLAKRMGKSVDDVEFQWNPRGISAANPAGIAGGIYFTVNIIDKNTKAVLAQTGIIKSNSNEAIKNAFVPIQEMAKYAYSGIPGVEPFGDYTLINAPVATESGEGMVVPLVEFHDGTVMGFEQFVRMETEEMFKTK